MPSISSSTSRTIHRRGEPGRVTAGHLVGPLFFSLVGLLMHCLALLMHGEASLAPLRFALIAGAAPVAAMVALRFIGDADEPLP
jgi:hypothetical protein